MEPQSADSWNYPSTFVAGLANIDYTFSPAEDGCRIVEVSAPTEGEALIAAGKYLQQQALSGAASSIEGIDWLLPGARSWKHTLILTVSGLEREEAC
ncbi:hypothetical protein [Pseudonocardia spinosispora]|uniref:hypothetical protein n=1 Tax=Pseudonocardia spinosispora TaxID=103441 RepID=UPI00042941B9|nr:hypothetical protein [Pseudonocardia spinosispora]